MNRPTLLVILCLFVKINTVTTLKSVGKVRKPVDSASASTTLSKATTASTTSVSPPNADAKSRAETSSKKSSPANATTSKPSSDLGLISSIPTFDFSMTKHEPKPEVVNICNTKDMCMAGFCVKGTCKMKKCSTDVICLCDPGFTGQFCDKNITEVELKNGKNGKSAGKAETKTASTNKELVNGRIDRKLLSENGNGENGNGEHGHYDNGHYDNGNNGNGKSKTGKRNGSDNGENGQKEINGDNGNAFSREGNGSMGEDDSNVKKENGNGKKENSNDKTKKSNDKKAAQDKSAKKHGKDSVQHKTKKVLKMKDLWSEKNIGKKKASEVPPDGSYVKGPEVYVSTDNSAINLKATQEKIGIGKPTVVKERTDKVTISTVAVEKTRLGIAPEMLASTKHDTMNTNVKATSHLERNVLKQSENPGKNQISKTTKSKVAKDFKGKNLKENMTESKRTIQEKLHMLRPQEEASHLDVVSTVDIISDNHVVVKEEIGVVDITNNTIGVSPLFANSEIKITIEASKLDKGNATQTSADLTLNKESKIATNGGKEISNIAISEKSKSDVKLTERNLQTKDINKPQKNLKLKSKNKNLVERTSEKTTTTEKSPKKSAGASKITEARTSMQSEILNPLIQLMNIIGSDKFVEKVSAVKIEIITKQNSTDTQKSLSKQNNKKNDKAVNGGATTETKRESQNSNTENLPLKNLNTRTRGTTQTP